MDASSVTSTGPRPRRWSTNVWRVITRIAANKDSCGDSNLGIASRQRRKAAESEDGHSNRNDASVPLTAPLSDGLFKVPLNLRSLMSYTPSKRRCFGVALLNCGRARFTLPKSTRLGVQIPLDRIVAIIADSRNRADANVEPEIGFGVHHRGGKLHFEGLILVEVAHSQFDLGHTPTRRRSSSRDSAARHW